MGLNSGFYSKGFSDTGDMIFRVSCRPGWSRGFAARFPIHSCFHPANMSYSLNSLTCVL